MNSPVQMKTRVRIPRNPENDYTHECAATRREFVREHTGVELNHVSKYSFEPSILPGNIENFTGVAQVPIGVAGPLLINGEHAKGEFLIPLATTEGTLVSSYSRGMKLLSESGGVKTTVTDDAMQRAPVFIFHDALEARDFGGWVEQNLAEIQKVANSTTRVGQLRNIQQFAVGPLRYLRFNYTSGDAAGQNMAGKATYVACEWIKHAHPLHPEYFLSGNIDTDKKDSRINMLLGRGKRVVAEAVVRGDLLQQYMHISVADLVRTRDVAMAGAFFAGSANNGAHAANALAALFIATGQDVANVAEAHAAITYCHAMPNGDYYWSITLPALIVATYGGGTALATQKECLEMLGCYGQGKVNKFAEICAAVVLAGETSLVSAMLHGDWVVAHEKYGRNR